VKYEIEVTKKDIENGKRQIASKCPVALAVKRDAKSNSVIVGLGIVMFRKNTKWTSLPLDAKVCSFIKKFDSGHKVKPFKFTLTVE
jgi:hypothetical protein